MSVSGEKLNLLIMRDSGETKRIRVRRSYFHTFVALLFCFPFLTVLAAWGIYVLWQDNAVLKEKLIHAEQVNQESTVKAERLSNLEKLLAYEKEMGTQIAQNTAPVAKNESTGSGTATVDSVEKLNEALVNVPNIPEYQEEVPIDDGPGHAEFPVLDEGIILVENVVSRLVEPRRIRTSLDLRNPGTASLAGEVFCILSLASGDAVPLTLSPANVGNYKILRWKKAVLFANIPAEHDLFNAQMIIEVKDSQGKLLYRNAFAIEQ